MSLKKLNLDFTKLKYDRFYVSIQLIKLFEVVDQMYVLSSILIQLIWEMIINYYQI